MTRALVAERGAPSCRTAHWLRSLNWSSGKRSENAKAEASAPEVAWASPSDTGILYMYPDSKL